MLFVLGIRNTVRRLETRLRLHTTEVWLNEKNVTLYLGSEILLICLLNVVLSVVNVKQQ